MSVHFVVLTGGPGAGKTAVMEAARQIFQDRVVLLPEAASIVYSGGFPRNQGIHGVRAAQRAIVHVQRELERYVTEERRALVALCDRGICDGAAYWPGGYDEFYEDIGLPQRRAFARYGTVIHLRTPSVALGYNLSNPMRIETPEQAALLDARIEQVWSGHPNRHVVDAMERFTDKVEHVTALIRDAFGSGPLTSQSRSTLADAPSLMQ